MSASPSPPPRMTLRGLALVTAAYAVLALFYTVVIEWDELAGGVGAFAREVAHLLPRSLLDYGLKGALTLPVWWLIVRRLDGRVRWQIVAHAVLGPLWVWAWFVLYRAVAVRAGYFVLTGDGAAWDVYIPALVYLAQFGAFHAARYVADLRARGRAEQALLRRQAELERTAQTAQLAALRAQMDPHFLFNTLNTVAASVPPEQGATRDLVARLAALVRYTLLSAQREHVPLRDEIAFVHDYLALERERMGQRLRTELEVDDDALDVPIPPMLVQPLVENAVRHGLAPVIAGGTVRVAVRRLPDRLAFSVRDDGAGPTQPLGDLLASGGVGLANTDARLRHHYGDGLTLACSPDSFAAGDSSAAHAQSSARPGFEVRFSIPLGPSRAAPDLAPTHASDLTATPPA